MPKGKYVRTEETLQKIRRARLGIPHSLEARQKMSIVHSGIAHSEEHKRKIAVANIGKHPNLGYKHTVEAKEKIRIAHTGKKRLPFSEEWRQRLSESRKGRYNSKETRRKISESNKGKPPTYSMLGKHHSEETRRRLRISAQNRLIRNGTAKRGNHEKEILDAQELIDHCRIDRSFYVIGYSPDGYCHETNTIYEVYEPFHEGHKERDLKRQTEIQDALHCNFVILYDPEDARKTYRQRNSTKVK